MMKDLCQKWKVKLIFRGIWNRLMARPDWPWPWLFYDATGPARFGYNTPDTAMKDIGGHGMRFVCLVQRLTMKMPQYRYWNEANIDYRSSLRCPSSVCRARLRAASVQSGTIYEWSLTFRTPLHRKVSSTSPSSDLTSTATTTNTPWVWILIIIIIIT